MRQDSRWLGKVGMAIGLGVLLLGGGGSRLEASPFGDAELRFVGGGVWLIDGNTLDFGTTTVGTPISMTVSVHNDGDGTLHIGGFSVPTGYTLEGFLSPIIPPGESRSVDIRLDATEVGFHGGTSFLHHDAWNEPSPQRILFSGTVDFAPGPRIRVMHGTVSTIPHESTFEMGSTVVGGSPIIKNIVVHNDGTSPLNISNLTVPFGFVVGDPLEASIPAGGSDNFGLRLTTGGAGEFSGEVKIFHDAQNEPSPFRFTAHGTVEGGAGPSSEIRVMHGTVATIGYGSTFQMGSATQGAAAIVKNIVVHNDGDAALNIQSVTVPQGFAIGVPLDSVIPPGSSDNFGLHLLTNSAGTISGQVAIVHDGGNHPVPFVFTAAGTIEESGPNPLAEIRVMHGTVSVIGYGSTFSMGTAVEGGDPITKNIVVHNDGDATLSISGLTVPDGFAIGVPLDSEIPAGGSDNFGLKLLTTSPGTKTGQVSIHHDAGNVQDPFVFTATGTVDFVVTPTAQIRLTQEGGPLLYGATVPMGSTTMGTPIFKAIEVHNDGDTDLELSSLTLPIGFSVGDPLDLSLGAGQSDVFELKLAATMLGHHNGWVEISHNADNESDPFRFQVTGFVSDSTSNSAEIRVTHGTVASIEYGAVFDMGVTTVGDSITKNIVVHNDGESALLISCVEVPAGFSLGVPLDTVIPAGGSDNFGLVLVGDSPGSISGSVQICHDGDNEPDPFVFTASGIVEEDSVPGPPPRVDSISPRTVRLGLTSTVVLTGGNFEGKNVFVPAPNSALRVPPTVLNTTVSLGGTRLTVVLDASDPRSEGIWMVVVQDPVDEEATDGIDFRVVPEGPVVDLWTPSEPIVGGISPLMITGANLEGAAVTASHPGIKITELDNEDDTALVGFLEVEPGVDLGSEQLTVQGKSGFVVLDMQILELAQTSPATHTLISDGPRVYLQEVTSRVSPSGPDFSTESSRTSPCESFSFQANLFSRSFVLKLDLLDAFGEVDPGILGNLFPGEVTRFGALSIILGAQIQLHLSFDLCAASSFQICLDAVVGASIPEIAEAICSFGFCVPGESYSFCEVELPGHVDSFHFEPDAAGSDCLSLNQVTPLLDGGRQFFDVSLPGCCPEPEASLLFYYDATAFEGSILQIRAVINGLPSYAAQCSNLVTSRLVVIDPGHGGTDPGKIGPGGTEEADVVLDIGLRVRDKLAMQGTVVPLLTRTTDVFVPLRDRVDVAVNGQAKAFVSIHLNSAVNCPSANGTETFIHVQSSTPSQTLANLVQLEVVAATGLPNRGVKTTGNSQNKNSGLVVLRPCLHLPDTAAALCEVSFLCDPVEEARLQNPAYLDQIATAIADAIIAFFP